MEYQVLELKYGPEGNIATLNPVVFRSAGRLILVDCGYPNSIEILEKAAAEKGISLDELSGVIITHHDIDHVGGLYELKSRYPAIKVYCSRDEEKFINGTERSRRLEQAESIFDLLPESAKPAALEFQESLRAVIPVHVDETFALDEDIPFLEDVFVVNTPGHLPQHISLYLRQACLMISADALIARENDFELPNPQYAYDLSKAIDSVERIWEFNLEKVVCYHGGVVTDNLKDKLEELLRKYRKS